MSLKENILYAGKNTMLRLGMDVTIKKWIRGFNGKVLEIGCSSARYMNYFLGDYHGLDLTDKEFPENGKFFVGNGCDIPFKSKYFDNVVCIAVLEHTEFPEKIIKEISRVTKRGGKALIFVPTKYGMKWEGYPKYKHFECSYFKKFKSFRVVKCDNVGGILTNIIMNIEKTLLSPLRYKRSEEDSRKVAKVWTKDKSRPTIFVLLRGFFQIMSLKADFFFRTRNYRPIGIIVLLERL